MCHTWSHIRLFISLKCCNLKSQVLNKNSLFSLLFNNLVSKLPLTQHSLVILLSFESSLRYACKFTQKLCTVFLNLTTNLKSYPNNFLIQTIKFFLKLTNGKHRSRIPQFSKTRWTKQIITIYNLENTKKLVGGFVCEFFTIEMTNGSFDFHGAPFAMQVNLVNGDDRNIVFFLRRQRRQCNLVISTILFSLFLNQIDRPKMY